MQPTIKDAIEISNIIAGTFDPVSIVLFGSLAEKGSGNDIDLLVVTENENSISEEMVQKYLKNYYKNFPIDPFVVSLDSVRENYRNGSPFLKKIFKDGRLLHMKNAMTHWIEDAKSELDTASYLLKGKYYKSACYHSQQAVEKAIKASLIKKGWELEKTHSIQRLISIAEDFRIKFEITDDDIVFMDSIYRGRYPAEAGLLPLGEPGGSDAQKAVTIALSILNQAKKMAKTTSLKRRKNC